MALSANTVWEVRTAGNDTNGGGFVAGAAGSDYSQQDSKNTVGADISTTDAVANGTTTITSVLANFGTTIVGNIVYFAGGTGTITGVWRQVTARASTTSITIDAAIAASTGMTMNIGGALASPGQAGFSYVAANTIYIKSGTYTILTASTNVSTGCLTVAGLSQTAMTRVEGYQTTRGDLGTKPSLVLNAGVTPATIVAGTANYVAFVNIEVDGAAQTSSRGFILGGTTQFSYRCHAKNCTNTGFTYSGQLVFCSATGCSTQPAFLVSAVIPICFCESYSNTISGFSAAALAGASFHYCLSYNNSGASSDGFLLNERNQAIGCIAYGNGQHGFSLASQVKPLINCIAVGNGGYGYDPSSAGTEGILLINCAGYNNTSGNYAAADFIAENIIGFKVLSADPFTNAAGGVFSLNNTSGGGADLRALGFPSSYPSGLTPNYHDIGAAQHLEVAGGSGPVVFGYRSRRP